jgi:acyl-CoA synthetase (NDP forming)
MAIESLLKPRSIAIVGASDRIGPGFNAWQALQFVGFEGPVYLINPNKSELFGRKTYPSLSDVEADQIDAVFAAVRTESTLDVMTQAVAKRVGAMTILSSGFSDAGEAGARVQRELADIANRNEIAVCGPNCLGLLNFSARSAMFGTSLPENVARGGIAAIVQSGSIGIALLNSGRQLGLSHLVTSGNEAVTTTADYLEAFIDDPAVETIIVFSEQIRKPARFIAMARRARECGKPLIVLKSGRSEKGRAAVMAHTGAVAGSVEACDAALEDSGAIQVHTLDELLETAALASRIRRMPTARGVAALSLSGGEIALALDAAEDNGIVFASVDAAHDQIKSLLPEFAHIANPLDLTWAGLYDAGVAEGCASALATMTDVGALVLIQDAPAALGPQQAARYASLLRSVSRGAEQAGKPLIALSNLSDEPHPELGRAASESGVPYLRGTREGLSAIARLSNWSTRPLRAMPSPTHPSVVAGARKALEQLGRDRLPAEHEARRVLSGYGVRGPVERFVSGVDEAVEAALELGFPVALKGIAAGLVHKTEAGLVKLRLASADEVRRAASDMFASGNRHAGGQLLGVLVQKMMSPIAELLVGARVDPDFGPLIVVGGGGVTVELYRDVVIRLAPVSPEEALAAISSTRVARLLDGWRGSPAGDRAALGETISAVSRFVSDFSQTIGEIEINPLAVFPEGQGCMALDCVIVPSGNP